MAEGVGPVEPSADARVFAKQMRDVFLALVAEGFSEDQALRIIAVALAAAAGKGDG